MPLLRAATLADVEGVLELWDRAEVADRTNDPPTALLALLDGVRAQTSVGRGLALDDWPRR